VAGFAPDALDERWQAQVDELHAYAGWDGESYLAEFARNARIERVEMVDAALTLLAIMSELPPIFDADIDAVDVLHTSLLVQAHHAMARTEPPGAWLIPRTVMGYERRQRRYDGAPAPKLTLGAGACGSYSRSRRDDR
jgi:hypothetical protein